MSIGCAVVADALRGLAARIEIGVHMETVGWERSAGSALLREGWGEGAAAAPAPNGNGSGHGANGVGTLERSVPGHTALERPPFGSRIESIGLELPERRLSTQALLDSRRHRFRVDLEKRTGIRERRVCSEGEDSFSLAVGAARDCLAHSRHEAGDLDLVISASITRWRGGLSYQFEPALSLSVKEAIGASQAMSFDVSNACAGMMTGIHVLNDFIRRGVVRRGMVVSGEYITSISDNAARSVRGVTSRQMASLTVGDAGAAVILERRPDGTSGIAAAEFVTFAEHSDLCIGRAAEDGPGAVMFTNAAKLHRAAIDSSTDTIRRVLEQTGLSLADIDYFIPHQTSVPAIEAGTVRTAQALGHDADMNVIVNLEEYGNTSSTTHFVALYKLLQERRLSPGQRVMLVCYASGLTIGALVFTVDELWERYGRGD